MPDSTKDRFTNDFEYLFFFTLNPKYYFEQQFEPYASSSKTEDLKRSMGSDKSGGYSGKPTKDYASANAQNPAATKARILESVSEQGRNRRSVWSLSPASYSGSHYAVFPPELVRTPIRAGCPAQVCSVCGKARERVVNSEVIYTRPGNDSKYYTEDSPSQFKGDSMRKRAIAKYSDGGWRENCACEGREWIPGVVLDPFGGSGTVGQVCQDLGRRCILIDIDPRNKSLMKDRCKMKDSRLEDF